MIYGIPLLSLNVGVITLNQYLQMTVLGHVVSTDKVLELINCKDGETVRICYEDKIQFNFRRHLALSKRGKEIYAAVDLDIMESDGHFYYDQNDAQFQLMDASNKLSKLQRVVWNKILELASAGIEGGNE